MTRIYCNKCGKEFDSWDMNEGFSLVKNLGYGTKYDGESLRLALCCKCMEKLIDECEISPIMPAAKRVVVKQCDKGASDEH